MTREKLIIVLGGALFVSLACNLFAAGLWLGHSYNPHGAPPHEEAAPADARRAEMQKKDEELRKQLSEPDRAILKSAMQQHRTQFQTLRQAAEEAHEKVTEAQNAQPFDQAALDAAMHDEYEKRQDLLKTLREVRDEIGPQLTPQGREVFSKLAPNRFGGGGWGGGHKGGPGPNGQGGPGPNGQGGPGPNNNSSGPGGPPPDDQPPGQGADGGPPHHGFGQDGPSPENPPPGGAEAGAPVLNGQAPPPPPPQTPPQTPTQP